MKNNEVKSKIFEILKIKEEKGITILFEDAFTTQKRKDFFEDFLPKSRANLRVYNDNHYSRFLEYNNGMRFKIFNGTSELASFCITQMPSCCKYAVIQYFSTRTSRFSVKETIDLSLFLCSLFRFTSVFYTNYVTSLKEIMEEKGFVLLDHSKNKRTHNNVYLMIKPIELIGEDEEDEEDDDDDYGDDDYDDENTDEDDD